MTARYNTAALRDLISAALTEDEFTALAFDYFRPVYNQFAAGQTLGQRVQLLLEHAARSGQMARLAALIQEINPARYREYADRLLTPDADATDAAPAHPQTNISYHATLAGSGAIAQGAGALAGGEGSIVVGGRGEGPASGLMAHLSPAETTSLLRQRNEWRENLRLIEERKSQFVQDTDVPLQLLKDERKIRERIADLEARLRQAGVIV